MNEINYSLIVQNTLDEQWKSHSNTLRIHKDDLSVAVSLFVKIALEEVQKPQSSARAAKPFRSSLDPNTETISSVKSYVENHSFSFKKICQTCFPFSLVDSFSAELALKDSIERDDSIFTKFMLLENDWKTERELEDRFSLPLQRIEFFEISKTCFNLKEAYFKRQDLKAGYYLLWLIKKASGCDYDIPHQTAFNNTSVVEVLNNFCERNGSSEDIVKFLSILHYRNPHKGRYFFTELLKGKSLIVYLNFVFRHLKVIPFCKWPIEGGILVDVLLTIQMRRIVEINNNLISSDDSVTVEIGYHLQGAIKAQSLRQALPHFYGLIDLIPSFQYEIACLFDRPFIDLTMDRTFYKGEPEFVKRLSFSKNGEVFVFDSTLIGIYDKEVSHGHVRDAAYILAFDINTEKMIWGIPLTSSPFKGFSSDSTLKDLLKTKDCRIQKVGEYLTLQINNTKYLYFIKPKTGVLAHTLELPEMVKDLNSLYISPDGYAYQTFIKGVDRYLIEGEDRYLTGGKIIENKWIPFFETKICGRFCSFSTHYGINDTFRDELVLFSPSGEHVIIESMDAKAHKDKLYTVQKDSSDKKKCMLTIRTLRTDNLVVAEIEKTILLNVENARIFNICDSGKVVLFSTKYTNDSPIFVDLTCDKVVYSDFIIKIVNRHIIKTDSGELLIWNYLKKEIWKVSETNIQMMGSMIGNYETSLLYVNHANQLYISEKR